MRDKLQLAIFLIALLFIGYMYGAFSATLRLFPYDHVREATVGLGAAIRVVALEFTDRRSPSYWRPVGDKGQGVLIADEARMEPGATLYGSSEVFGADLIAADGTVLHSWRPSFEDIWDGSAPYRAPGGIDRAICRKPLLLDDGSLICVIHLKDTHTPYGGGMIKLDRNGKVVWRYFKNSHHDAKFMPGGAVITLNHTLEDAKHPAFPDIEPPYLTDQIAIVDKDGQEVMELSLMDAIAGSGFEWTLYPQPDDGLGDVMHANSIHVADTQAAAVLDHVNEGDFLVSFRTTDTLVLVDHQTKKVKWAVRGGFKAQHDAEFLDNGDILLFDNRGPALYGGKSRVLELSARGLGIVWDWHGAGDVVLDSDVKASQQRLANGNTLITEAMGGRMFEVTAGGEIVWHFVNPVQEDGFIAAIQQALRIGPDHPFVAERLAAQ